MPLWGLSPGPAAVVSCLLPRGPWKTDGAVLLGPLNGPWLEARHWEPLCLEPLESRSDSEISSRSPTLEEVKEQPVEIVLGQATVLRG